MNLELCTSSIKGVKLASQYNFKRVELCSALSVGGLTPSLGLIEKSLDFEVEIHCMLRHKEGNFNYSKEEIKILAKDITEIAKVGAKGVVFGVLTPNLNVSEYNKELIEIAKNYNLEVTFHRAFDVVDNPHESIEKLIDFKFDRLLTSGLKSTAFEGINLIANLQKNYGNSIQIMAGSGVNASNALEFVKAGTQNLHFTAHKVELSQEGMGTNYVVDEEKIKLIASMF